MSDEQGLTRRQLIKKGAFVGGALVWAVPVVQTIGMTPALAQTTSGDGAGGCTTYYAVRITSSGTEDIAGQTPDGHCFDPSGATPGGLNKGLTVSPLGINHSVMFSSAGVTILKACIVSGPAADGVETQRRRSYANDGISVDGNTVVSPSLPIEILFCE